MRRLTAAFSALAASTLLGATASAHDSMSMFDPSEVCDEDVAHRYIEK